LGPIHFFSFDLVAMVVLGKENICGNAMRVDEVRMNAFANSYKAFCK
tara:strand:- start:690 stop:830 length:141 start_codon:yes stop_codon:yes gene_type:complete